MKSKTVLTTIMALALVAGPMAFAQGDSHGPGSDRWQREESREHRQNHNSRRDNREERRDERGAGPEHEFHRGDRLPPQYHNRQYVVDDWRGHRLSEPPRGYHWVQYGSDYVLVAIATGVILNLMLSR